MPLVSKPFAQSTYEPCSKFLHRHWRVGYKQLSIVFIEDSGKLKFMTPLAAG
jgi:hypothetical protein